MASRLSRNDIDRAWRIMLEEIGRNAVRIIRPRITASRTLRESLQVFIDRNTRVIVRVPYYWAQWVHDGRGRINAKPGKFLVWFEEPQRTVDPRIQGGYPRRAADKRRLTEAQFRAGLEENRRRRLLAGGKDYKPYMIVRKTSGPVHPSPFFDLSRPDVLRSVEQITEKRIRALLTRGLNGLSGTYPVNFPRR